MEFSIEHRRSLSKMAVAFAELKQFVLFAVDNPSTTSTSIVELGAIRVDNNGVVGEGM
jgi:hypothetical protein